MATAAVAAAPLACGSSNSGSSGSDDSGSDASVEVGPDVQADDGSADGSAGDSAAASDGGDGGLDATGFCQGTYGVLRKAFESCCSAADITNPTYPLYDQLLGGAEQLCATQLAKSVGDGRATFNVGDAQSCVALVKQLASGGSVCWPTLTSNQSSGATFGTPPCNGVVTGLQAQGQPCAQDYECQNGLTCVGWTTSADGTCQQPPARGAACGGGQSTGITVDYGFGSHPQCASGSYCNKTCLAQAAGGQACTTNAECQAGLVCRQGKCGTATPSGPSGPCVQKSDCQNGLYCEPGDGGASGTCQTRQDAGAACTQTGDQCKGVCDVPDSGVSGTCAAICGSG
jgi:hypothetical protein